MERRVALSLLDAYDAATEIDSFVAEIELSDYMKDRVLRLAVQQLFVILGEALSQASKRDASIVSLIPHARDAIDMRNWLIHGYNDVSDKVVWSTAIEDIPVLRAEIRQLLESSQQWSY